MRKQVRAARHARQGGRLQRLALNFGAVIGTLCLLLTLAALLFGLKPLVFASGSMGPAIPTGSLGLAVPTPVEDVAVGDVVSVVTSEQVRVTHRVVEKTDAGLILKGDANPVADLHPYAVDGVDKLLGSAPGLGYLVTWLSQPWAYFLGGLLCAYLLYIAFFRRTSEGTTADDESAGAPDGAPPTEPTRVLPALSILLCLGMVLGLAVQPPQVYPTLAAFSGSARATTGNVNARSMPSIAGSLSCRTTGGILGAATSAEVSWTQPTLPPGSRYAVRVQSVTGDVRFLNVNKGTNMINFNGGLSLLGLLFGKAQTFQASVLTVITTDGAAVNEQGTNIGWSSPLGSAPSIAIKYSPGILILDSYACA